MFDSPIQQIRDRLDIVEVIGGYLKLKKVGANFRTVCPFHSEKKPSFFVSPARQIWHCFGCSKGGDIFGFIKEIEGVEFGDALRILAQKAGIQLKRQDPKLITERKLLYEICELATKFFEKQLESSKTGQKAKKYLLDRQISEDSIKKWRIGYAPDTWQGLSSFLRNKGYPETEIVRAGLAIKGENTALRDRFSNRIIFPVFDLNSQVVGFGGRIFQETGNKKQEAGKGEQEVRMEPAKYINTPGTLIYDKSRILYGLDKAKVEIRKKDSFVIVEGYIDTIMSAQAGIANVVATSGTALTPYQLNLLRRYSKNAILGFDMDVAGDTATKRGIDLAQAQGFNLKVIVMPSEKDPADIIASQPRDWEELVLRTKDIIEFYFETTLKRFGDKVSYGPEEKVKVCEILLPVIKKIPNKILQSHWLAELAKKLKVEEEDLEVELKKYSFPETGEPREGNEQITPQPKKSRQEMLEEKILCSILQEPKDLNFLEEHFFSYLSSRTQIILGKLREKNFGRENIDPIALKDWDEETRYFLNYLSLRGDLEREETKESEKEVLTCFKDLKNLMIKQELEKISKDIKTAEEAKDSEKVESLLERFNELTKQLN